MSVLCCIVDIPRDVAKYILAPMIDRVTLVALAQACGFDFALGGAFYREAAGMGYWKLCKVGEFDTDLRFACGYGAAVYGDLKRVRRWVPDVQLYDLFDAVCEVAHVKVWNFLYLRERQYMGWNRTWAYKRRLAGLLGLVDCICVGIMYQDLSDMMPGAHRAGRLAEFIKWVHTGINNIGKYDIIRAVIMLDDVSMAEMLIDVYGNAWTLSCLRELNTHENIRAWLDGLN